MMTCGFPFCSMILHGFSVYVDDNSPDSSLRRSCSLSDLSMHMPVNPKRKIEQGKFRLQNDLHGKACWRVKKNLGGNLYGKLNLVLLLAGFSHLTILKIC